MGSELDSLEDGGTDAAWEEWEEDDIDPAVLEAALVTNQGPNVSLTSPRSGATFAPGASIVLMANASDADGVVSKVEFFAGTTKLGQDVTSPYSFTFANVALGNYRLSAKATDNAGAATTSSTVDIHVIDNTQPPRVFISAPSQGTSVLQDSTVTISAVASDPDGSVSKVDFFDGSTRLGEDVTAPYALSFVAALGSHDLTARATDNTGLVTTSAVVRVTAFSRSTPPTVSITSPVEAATIPEHPGVSITAVASDTDGVVTKVDFFDNGELVGTDGTNPYTLTYVAEPGDHTLTAVATDNAALTTTSSVVRVRVVADASSCTNLPQYVENGGYSAGSTVKNGTHRFRCKPWPYSSWCNGAAWAYAPGPGAYWMDAWDDLGGC